MAVFFHKVRKQWIVKYKDDKGKWRWEGQPRGSKKSDGKVREAELIEQVRSGGYIHPSQIPTLREVAKEWLEDKRDDVSKSTFCSYQDHVNTHIKRSSLADRQVNKIGPKNIKDFGRDLAKKNLRTSTVQKYLSTLKQILNYCVEYEYITHSPADKVKFKKNSNGGYKAIEPFTSSELMRILEAAPDTKHMLLFKTAIQSGARIGEILGFKWKDLKENGAGKYYLRIERQYWRGEYYRPKTENSIREIDIPRGLAVELKEYQLASKFSGSKDPIFPNQKGGALQYTNLNRRKWKKTLENAGVKHRTFHTLRHTFASMALMDNIPVLKVSRLLGHAHVGITMARYAHYIQEDESGIAERIGELTLGSK